MLIKGKIYLISFLSIFSHFSFSQINLVPNPSFETYTNCPTTLDQMNKCLSWSAYRSTPDYYNICSTTSGIYPPNCVGGFQWPKSGTAYAGFMAFDNTGTSPNYREIMGAPLTNTLVIGQKYFISFFISKGSASGHGLASDKMGVRFSTVPFSTISPVPINNSAHYYTTAIITDTTNWVQLKGSFVSDSAYKYIMIGNFFNDINTDTITTDVYNQIAYYYLDDLCVSTDSMYNELWTKIPFFNIEKKLIKIFPNPASNILYIKSTEEMEEIQISDFIGNIVYKATEINSSNFDFFLENFLSGIYTIRIHTKNKFSYLKLNISH